MKPRLFSFLCGLGLGIVGCSSFTEKRVVLRSIPDGAEVVTANGGKSLGKTPLTLEKQDLAEASVDGRLDVIFRSPRFVERQVTLDVIGDDLHTVQLSALDENYFSQRLLEEFRTQANDLVRHLMTAQGFAFAGKLADAERELTDIEKHYPNLAPIYVLRADIERSRGNHDKARGYLRRALSLDPRDPVATRMLELEKTEGGDKW